MFLLQIAVVLLLVIAAVAALVLQARRDVERDARRRSLDIAESLADAPGMVPALQSPDPSAVLQPMAERVRQATGVDLITILGPTGVRLATPYPELLGQRTDDDMPRFFAEGTVTFRYPTDQGDAVISAVSVYGPDGAPLGLVGAGITVASVNDAVYRQWTLLLGGALGALAVTAGGAAVISRRLRRQTRGLQPAEITRMYEHHDAVLHAVREGVLITDADGRVLLANDEARRLLDLPEDVEGRSAAELGLDPALTELLASGRAATDEVHPAGDRLLAVNSRPTAPYGPAGCAVTLRDSTELQALTGRAEETRQRLNLLYEASMRIGSTLDIMRTAEELAEVGVPRFADIATVDLLDPVLSGAEPSGRATRMRRAANRWADADRPPPLHPIGDLIDFGPTTPMGAALTALRPVLETDLAAAAEGWRTQDPERADRVLAYGIHSLISVPLRARGVVLGMATYWRCNSSEPFDAEDVSFAEQLTARAAVSIDNARRYTREHAMAVTLQRSLLPGGLPEPDALDAAYRYLPAQAGVGGDWFDVIPLPGARVALVVGDVVGHGLHAAATMGRLRTAVHNFSALDLPPDEMLGHLDDLVARIDRESHDPDDTRQITGATCLYAVYDPVSGRATVARAGHPGPAQVTPDGEASFPDVPASLPLGLNGSLPIDCVDLVLPHGSRLVLFTDGLVEDRRRDLDTGLRMLETALASAGADATPEQTCDTVMGAMLTERPSDDIALLVARTRLFDPARVATWDVPSDPAAVAGVRAACARQLQAWGLGEIDFTAELVLSELVTNAIRYGIQPIRVRLLRTRTLVCEVSDGSSTSPHLRRAATTDEGGRGLFLVAKFAERWGTRYNPQGKVIWAELPLDRGAEPLGDVLTDALLDQWDDIG
ncbi:SpoIIE family protein phosphatase [Embleya sp. NBC_00896]|uniref:SpoIIE family protein phosphatase n=1 Tax=Embleya sp. NBC_00896 TaxID=2975961 RepID=UPI00386A7264|nr:SpoIIE family protein phosphatase [Embleya sp. NBC_00896]